MLCTKLWMMTYDQCCTNCADGEQEESLETQDRETGHVLTLITDPYTGGGAMQGAASGIGVGNRLWLLTDKLPFKVRGEGENLSERLGDGARGTNSIVPQFEVLQLILIR